VNKLSFKTLLSYDEKVLASEFTFGFELEAYLEYMEVASIVDNLKSSRDYEDECYIYLEKFFEDLFEDVDKVTEKGEVQDESSLTHKIGFFPFEWSSPVLKFSPSNILKVISKLNKVFETGLISIDHKCGFHIHLGLPSNFALEDKELDIFWFNLNIVESLFKNPNFLEDIISYKGISLYDDYYASFGYLKKLSKEINYHLDRTEEEGANIDSIRLDIIADMGDIYSTRKYNIFALHGRYGTMEWRGPRGFLDQGTDIVKGFFLERLYPMVMRFSSFMDKDEITFGNFTFSKKEMFQRVVKSEPLINRPKSKGRFSHAVSNEVVSFLYRTYPSLREGRIEFNDVEARKINNKIIISSGFFKNGMIDKPISFNQEHNRRLRFSHCTFDSDDINFYKASDSVGPMMLDQCNILKAGTIRNADIHYSNVTNAAIIKCDLLYSFAHNGCVINNSTIRFTDLYDGVKVVGSRITHECKIYTTDIEGCEISRSAIMSDKIKEELMLKNEII
jgi:hypothetical protein